MPRICSVSNAVGLLPGGFPCASHMFKVRNAVGMLLGGFAHLSSDWLLFGLVSNNEVMM